MPAKTFKCARCRARFGLVNRTTMLPLGCNYEAFFEGGVSESLALISPVRLCKACYLKTDRFMHGELEHEPKLPAVIDLGHVPNVAALNKMVVAYKRKREASSSCPKPKHKPT